MKLFASFILAFLLFSACSKKDLEKWTKRGCDIAEQADVYFNGKNEVSRNVVKKTYNSNGTAKSLSVRSVDASNFYDSMYCTFEYQKNAAVVHVKYITRFVDGYTAETITNYDLAVTFDPITGFATRVGEDAILYENKKVKSFGDLTFSYDNNGNLISIYKNQGNPETEYGERYTYDLNYKAGKHEVYNPSTLAVGTYNTISMNAGIAEIMRWLPTQSTHRRIRHETVTAGYVLKSSTYSDHKYKDGKLISFSLSSSRIENTWKCY